MRPALFIVAMLVVALVSGAHIVFAPTAKRHVTTTEEVRSPRGHDHRTLMSWNDDTDDDDDDDDDMNDDAMAGSILRCEIAFEKTPPLAVTFAPIDRSPLGPASAHHRLLERPPRA